MGEIRIRAATVSDIPRLLRHRRMMWWDMGRRDQAALDLMDTAASEYFATAVADGSYRTETAPQRPIMKKNVLFAIPVLSVISLSFGANSWVQQPTPQDSGRPCTMEAKLCPDGSSVGRVGPNCEFAPCPAGKPEEHSGSGAQKIAPGVPRSPGVVGGGEGNADESRRSASDINVEQPVWPVPKGKAVMVDGNLERGEWDDALVRAVPGLAARVYVKQSDQYVLLAVELERSEDGVLDLYLSSSAGDVYDLHASAKLGERRLTGGTWPAWEWWNNVGWIANTSRVESFEKRSFLPTKIREFQISRSRFSGHAWKIMLEVMTPAEPEWKLSSYPSGSKSTDTRGWIRLELE